MGPRWRSSNAISLCRIDGNLGVVRMPDFRLETDLGGIVCGIDEVGRGPWAGPVVAAAVILDPARLPADLRAAIDDSKKVPATRRPAMARALARLPAPPDAVLVDGNRAPPLGCRVVTVVGGDGLSLSIAAASIVAKVMRDAMMAKLAVRHPGYGWETNVGYGTEGHREGLSRFGVTRHHRRSFAPITHMLSL